MAPALSRVVLYCGQPGLRFRFDRQARPRLTGPYSGTYYYAHGFLSGNHRKPWSHTRAFLCPLFFVVSILVFTDTRLFCLTEEPFLLENNMSTDTLICSDRTQPEVARNFLEADCGACKALCCVLLPFDADQGFAFNKAAGTPCSNLTRHFRCSIHVRL